MEPRSQPPSPPPDTDIEALRAELERIPSEEARARARALLDRIARHDARLQAVIQDQPDPLFRFHVGGRITFVNPACCAYWGRERVELLGRPVSSLLPSEGWGALVRVSQKLSMAQPTAALELRVLGPSGAPCWHRWSLRLVIAEPGGEPGPAHLGRVEYQVLATDISERTEQHQLLAQHIAERRRLERVYGQRIDELEAQLVQRDGELADLRGVLGVEAEEDTAGDASTGRSGA
ncbi:MAG: PAS domain S-box protein [Pseudomonadota bacterium]